MLKWIPSDQPGSRCRRRLLRMWADCRMRQDANPIAEIPREGSKESAVQKQIFTFVALAVAATAAATARADQSIRPAHADPEGRKSDRPGGACGQHEHGHCIQSEERSSSKAVTGWRMTLCFIGGVGSRERNRGCFLLFSAGYSGQDFREPAERWRAIVYVLVWMLLLFALPLPVFLISALRRTPGNI